jgi:hypothetical protein
MNAKKIFTCLAMFVFLASFVLAVEEGRFMRYPSIASRKYVDKVF